MSIVIPQANPDPFLLDEIIQTLQLGLEQDCSLWLDSILPLAFVGESREKDGHTFPRIFLNNSTTDYLDAMPDTSKKGIVFFEVDGDFTFDSVDEAINPTINAIFWCNLDNIDKRGYDYTSELIANGIKCIKNSLSNYIVDISVTQNPEEIYTNYNLPQEELQQFMFPYTGFKLSFEVENFDFNLDCIQDFKIHGC